jgi:hypothetical protein
MLQICSLRKTWAKKRTTKDRVFSCAFVPYICYDKKTEFLSCFCLIDLLRQNDCTKERFLPYTLGTTKRPYKTPSIEPNKRLCLVPEIWYDKKTGASVCGTLCVSVSDGYMGFSFGKSKNCLFSFVSGHKKRSIEMWFFCSNSVQLWS